jgi:DNA-binding response OmpR family regulator
MPPASVLLVDDDRELSAMLVEFLSAEAFRVVAVLDGPAALRELGRGKFDLVILDVMLPGVTGFDVLRRVRDMLPVPVIMLTAGGDDGDRLRGFDLGADDCLPKPFNRQELLARMHAVLRRSGGEVNDFSRDIAFGPLQLDCASLDARIDGLPLRLTPTEYRLLEMLMRSPRRALTRELLSERVLGRRMRPNDRKIDSHVVNLRSKIGAQRMRSKIAAQRNSKIEIRAIRGVGYMLTLQW